MIFELGPAILIAYIVPHSIVILANVLQIALYSTNLTKYLQTIHLEVRSPRVKLLGLTGHPVRLDYHLLSSHWEYDFAEYSILLEEDFNPNDDWTRLVGVLARIYCVICEHAAITDIADKVIKKNLREILDKIRELHTRYPAFGITALGLNKIFNDF